MPDIRSDFSRTARVLPEDFEWVPSPGGEVHRVMLDRVGDEVAVATSLVRYPPSSRFPPHEHALGEEFLVLEGELGDEYGRYPAGTYVRNPPGSRHTPFSDPGCVVWVKLRQFHPDDDRRVVSRAEGEVHRFDGEVVSLLHAGAGAVVRLPGRESVQEVLVVEGAVEWESQIIGAWGWLRVPAGEGIELTASASSRLLYKTRPAFALPGASVTSARSAASEGT